MSLGRRPTDQSRPLPRHFESRRSPAIAIVVTYRGRSREDIYIYAYIVGTSRDSAVDKEIAAIIEASPSFSSATAMPALSRLRKSSGRDVRRDDISSSSPFVLDGGPILSRTGEDARLGSGCLFTITSAAYGISAAAGINSSSLVRFSR